MKKYKGKCNICKDDVNHYETICDFCHLQSALTTLQNDHARLFKYVLNIDVNKEIEKMKMNEIKTIKRGRRK